MATGSDYIISSVMEVSEVKPDDVIETLTKQLKEHFKIKEAEQEIVAKYKIKVQRGGLWEPKDTKRAWGKIQRMKTRESRRIPWMFATLSKCRKWEMKQQLDNHNRDKEVMERKLKGLQDRSRELKTLFENEQLMFKIHKRLIRSNFQRLYQNRLHVILVVTLT